MVTQVVREKIKKRNAFIVMAEQESIEALKMKPHILYYSQRSKPAMALFKKIEADENLQIIFNPICIDFQGIEHGIRSVPALIINKKEILCGKEAFDWIENNQVKDFDCSFSQYSSNFSSINDEYMENNFEQLGNSSGVSAKPNSKDAQIQDETKQIMDQLMEKRKHDVPQPLQRV